MTDQEARTLHCECGCEDYRIRFVMGGDVWAECADCGRPTSAVGDGMGLQPSFMENRRKRMRDEFSDEVANADGGDVILFDEHRGELDNLGDEDG